VLLQTTRGRVVGYDEAETSRHFAVASEDVYINIRSMDVIESTGLQPKGGRPAFRNDGVARRDVKTGEQSAA
jgi:hypothetical protein